MSDEEFDRRFGTEEACRDYLFRSRWPQGFFCPNCTRHAPCAWLSNRRLKCGLCGRKASLTAGTVLERTRKPFTLWFRAAFLAVQRGASARLLSRRLNLTYKVAWLWHKKLQALMSLATTLRSPEPPVPEKITSPQARRMWAILHGQFQWQADRPGGLDDCCGRLVRKDWHEPLQPWPLLATARSTLCRDHSGCVSDVHLGSYLRETEFRLNHRARPPRETAAELLGRFARQTPLTYDMVRRPGRRRGTLELRPELAPRAKRRGDEDGPSDRGADDDRPDEEHGLDGGPDDERGPDGDRGPNDEPGPSAGPDRGVENGDTDEADEMGSGSERGPQHELLEALSCSDYATGD